MQRRRKQVKNTRMVHIRLAEELHKKVRIRAAEADTTIQDWVVAAIETQLERQKEGEG
jgi:predicted HicB family RNase H-like nuclease